MSDNILAFLWFLSLPIIGCMAAGKEGMLFMISGVKRIFIVAFKIICWFVIGAVIVGSIGKIFSGSDDAKVTKNEIGYCEKGGVYSKRFNCEYIFNKATYDVYYWRYLNNDKSEREVGTVVGLSACRDTAIHAHRDANTNMKQDLEWSERMYVCMLTKDGRNLEKHRLF